MSPVTEDRRHKTPVVVFVSLVFGVSVFFWLVLLWFWGRPNLLGVLFFWALHMLATLSSVEVSVGGLSAVRGEDRKPLRISAGALILMAAAFATNPATAATVALIPVFRIGANQRLREDFIRTIFNTGQEVLYAGATAAIYWGVISAQAGVWWQIVGAVLAIASGAVLNAGLVAGVVAVERGAGLLNTGRRLLWPLLGSLAFGAVAFLVGTLYRESGPLAAGFILTPLFVMAQSRRARVEFTEAQERTLRAFVRAIELKDVYTSRHSERVAEIAVQLHRKLGAPESSIRRRFYAALMHDLGKVAIPGNVLGKRGPLTAEEFEVVKGHSAIGAEVVEGIEALADLAPEILYHHERPDGCGYPAGLTGEHIPREAKVLAVADVFEALTSDRPYRGGLSEDEALAEMQRVAGTQLDGHAVVALKELLEEGYAFPSLGGSRTSESVVSEEAQAEHA